MKMILIALLSVVWGVSLAVAAPVVDGVTLTASADGSFEIAYNLAEGPAVVTLDVLVDTGTGEVSVGDANLQRVSGDVNRKVSKTSGLIRWTPTRAAQRLMASGSARAKVTAWPMDDTPDYMMVPLSASGTADEKIRYYTSSNAVPGGVLSNLAYRTTKLLLRKIRAKGVTWWMGSDRTNGDGYHDPGCDAKHQVTLDHNYYFAVFPLTQSQVRVIQDGNWALTAFKNATRSLRIQDTVLYTAARGANWPEAPRADSILGRLRALTGQAVDFDLPCESEWEFAARAEHGTGYWGTGEPIDLVWNTNLDNSRNVNGRYNWNQSHPDWMVTAPPGATGSWVDWGAPNCGTGDGTPVAGSYAPNTWGIYDTSGGVWEWCNDWYQADISGLKGAVNVSLEDGSKCMDGSTPTTRVIRGGSWASRALNLVPGNRNNREPGAYGGFWDAGIRVVCRMGLK